LQGVLRQGLAQDAQTQDVTTPVIDRASTLQQFGGPNSVPGQLAEDARVSESRGDRTRFQNYFDWKDCLREKRGLSYSLDYTSVLLGASNTLNQEDAFSGGAVRFFGSWTLAGRDTDNTGSFIWKVENRHRYTDIPPSGVASEIGYAGLNMPVISDQGSRITNLYWKQNLNEGRVEIIVGMIDTTDWVDLYALASPWTGFFNFAMATGGASIPVPDDAAIGMYVNAMLTDNLYFIGGIADSNANSSKAFGGFDTFFNDDEYFTTLELGWVTSRDRFYFDNTHLTFWHADERQQAGVSNGWGASFSFEHAYQDKWLPFFRAGYADDGGSLLQKTISTGLGYQLKDDVSLVGLGFNWGQPNEGTFGPGLGDQYVVELFSRLQVTDNLEVTPDVQWISNPALNPSADQSWILGLRARLVF
jgi:porin